MKLVGLNRSFDFPWSRILFMYCPRDGATQIPISEFEANEMAQLKSLGLVRPGSVNSKTAYWPNTSSR